MAVTFPSLTPTARSFTAPKWPTKGVTSQSGVVSKRLWGNKPSQGTLTLTFNNITDDNAALILSAYNSAKGSLTDLTLPSQVFGGVSSNLKTGIDATTTTAGLKWFFTEDGPPSVESTAPGRCNVQVTLVAELRLA